MDSKKIGKFICGLRNEKKWTQEDLANKLFVDRTMVSKWERGVYVPSTEILIKMQSLFDITINEILYGERKDSNNTSNIDSIPIKLVKEEKKKEKKILIINTIIIFLLVFSFLSYYFVNNYNSIKIYKIFGSNAGFSISDGLLVVTKEKSYIKIGDLETQNNRTIASIKLYFQKGKEEKNIFETGVSGLNKVYTNRFNYNELFEYNDLNYILKGLKLNLILDDGTEITIDLKLEKDYANNKFVEDLKEPISDGEKIFGEEEVPEYIKNNFVFDNQTNEYIRKSKNKMEEYNSYANVYILTFYYQNYEEKIFYNLKEKTFEYYIFKDEDVSEYYIYDSNKETCEFGNCNIEYINKIKNDYFKNL